MKTKQIISGKREILLVEGLPEDSDDFKFFNDKHLPYLSFRTKNMIIKREYDFPTGDWKFLNRLSEITEEQAAELVEYDLSTGLYNGMYSKKEGFLLLLEESGVLFENPMGRCPPVERDCICSDCRADNREDLREWEELEAIVFRPESTLVFVKE